MADAARRIRLLKRLALLVFLLSVAGVAALYYLGRAARLGEEPSQAVPDELAAPPGQQSGEGFDHTLMRGDDPLFRIRGTRDRQTAEGRLIVEDVEVTVFRADGTELKVWANEASYDLEEEEASLRGDVRVRGADGFTMSTKVLFVVSGGDAIQTDGPLEFTYGGESPLHGRADWFRANLRRNVFILRGQVVIRSEEGAETSFLVRAPRVFLERNENMLRALDGVRVEWSASVVTARKVTAHLGPRNREIQLLRALEEVEGRITPGGSGAEDGFRQIAVEGERLGILFAEDGSSVSKIELEMLEGGLAKVRADRAGGETLELVARYLQGDLVAGELTSMEAVDDVLLTQTLPGGGTSEGGEGAGPVTRTASGRRADATFAPDGSIAVVELQGGVRIVEEPRTLTGQRARILPERLEAFGEPARFVSPEGELDAPSISFHQPSGLAHATGGVQAVMEREERDEGANPLAGTPLGESREPVRVVAGEAYFRNEPRSFLFKERVRAWSGEQVILTEQLRGDSDPQRLSAAEGVETQWTMEPEPGAEPRPIRINARTMLYEPDKGQLEYRDQVTVVEPERRLTCRVLTAELDEDGQVRSLTCRGDVVLESEAEGRRVEAARAEYDLATRRARFFGDPIRMTDREGLEVQCRELEYSLEAETVRCLSTPRAEPPAAGAEPNPDSDS